LTGHDKYDTLGTYTKTKYFVEVIKMDILAKMHEKNDQFEQLKAGIIERQNKIQSIKAEAEKAMAGLNDEIAQIGAEMNKIQGEYRLLTEMGIEAGILNEDGTEKTELKLVGNESVAPAK
jgi:hypothetical protein